MDGKVPQPSATLVGGARGVRVQADADLICSALERRDGPIRLGRNIAERIGPVILVIPCGVVVRKSPDGGDIEIRFDAEDRAS